MKSWLRMIALIAVLFLAACQAKLNLDEPPEIRYGEDVCDRCNMIISEARFAAATVTPRGDVRRFDDIGEMLTYHQETKEETAVFWVHDYETEAWLKAEDAFFVSTQGLATPMGSGIVACASRDQAEALAAKWDGMVLSFADLPAKAGEALMGKMHAHDG